MALPHITPPDPTASPSLELCDSSVDSPQAISNVNFGFNLLSHVCRAAPCPLEHLSVFPLAEPAYTASLPEEDHFTHHPPNDYETFNLKLDEESDPSSFLHVLSPPSSAQIDDNTTPTDSVERCYSLTDLSDVSGGSSIGNASSTYFYRIPVWKHTYLHLNQTPKVETANANKVLIIVTGGTICMTSIGAHKTLKPMEFVGFLKSITEINSPVFPCYDILQWEHFLDSSDIGTMHWKAIAKQIEKYYDSYSGFVILHGTDTMAYTAAALSFMLENLGKPVILTGSMIPIGEVSTDARRNMAVALRAANSKQISEVAVVFGSRIMRGNRVTKWDCSQMEAFDTPNFPPLGRVGVSVLLNDSLFLLPPKNPFSVHLKLCERILVFSMTPYFSSTLLREVMLNTSLPSAVVLKIYGSGTIPSNDKLLKALKLGIDRGVSVTVLSQCLKGHVELSMYENGAVLSQIGVINGKDMTTEACIAKLAYLMGKGYEGSSLKLLMESDICGEISERFNSRV